MAASIRLLLLLSLGFQSACAVGRVYVAVPPRLPANTLGHLDRPLTFNVCIPDIRPGIIDLGRQGTAYRVRRAFAEVGVTAELETSTNDPVDLTITLRREDGGEHTSLAVSALSFSVLPGYDLTAYTLDADLAWAGEARERRTEHLRYQSSERLFIWLPLIVYPDVVATPGGVWERAEKKDAGIRRMVWRLADDIRMRIARDGAMPTMERTGGVTCSKEDAP